MLLKQHFLSRCLRVASRDQPVRPEVGTCRRSWEQAGGSSVLFIGNTPSIGPPGRAVFVGSICCVPIVLCRLPSQAKCLPCGHPRTSLPETSGWTELWLGRLDSPGAGFAEFVFTGWREEGRETHQFVVPLLYVFVASSACARPRSNPQPWPMGMTNPQSSRPGPREHCTRANGPCLLKPLGFLSPASKVPD